MNQETLDRIEEIKDEMNQLEKEYNDLPTLIDLSYCSPIEDVDSLSEIETNVETSIDEEEVIGISSAEGHFEDEGFSMNAILQYAQEMNTFEIEALATMHKQGLMRREWSDIKDKVDTILDQYLELKEELEELESEAE